VIFQIFLTLFIVVMALYVSFSKGLYIIFKGLILTMLAIAVVFVYYPHIADHFANFVGVALAADLLFYLTSAFVMFFALRAYTHAKETRREIETLTRELTLLSQRYRELADKAQAEENE